jgi:phosphoglycerate dehydrogenase-like enzyme
MSLSIVFHGSNAAVFAEGFSDLLTVPHMVHVLPDQLSSETDKALYAQADIVIGISFNPSLPHPKALKLYHVPGAGYDGIDIASLPDTARLCNCFGHEQPIAEYVMAAILNRAIPVQDADQHLRQGQWKYWAGGSGLKHQEIAGLTIGLLGFGHIGKAIAKRAKAFDMRVLVANRSPVAPSAIVDASYTLDQMQSFCSQSDVIVSSLPLSDETRGLVGRDAFDSMKKTAVVINVGRGPVIDEEALFDALHTSKIAGAIIDTWYQYPTAQNPTSLPAGKPFQTLSNLIMTPHMSGWTQGTISRRQKTIADNINRVARGEAPINQVR